MLGAEPFWSFETQVDIVLAYCIIHNHIIGVDPNDPLMEEEGSKVQDEHNQRTQQTQQEEREEN